MIENSGRTLAVTVYHLKISGALYNLLLGTQDVLHLLIYFFFFFFG